MNDAHVADRAALYALGALDEQESAAVQAHVSGCPQCEQVVGAAEGDVLLLASQGPRHRAPAELDRRVHRLLQPPNTLPTRAVGPRFAALAAAFLIGILPSLYLWQQNRSLRENSGAQRVAGFRSNDPSLAASVTYAPDGSWYVIFVRGASRTLGVAWMHDGRQTMLGSAKPHDGVAMLYLPKSHRMNQLALVDGVRVVADAQLPY
jgi:hypothetical protein